MQKFIAIASFAIGCYACAPAPTEVPPGSAFIRITGRVQHTPDSAALYWPGTSMKVRFSGKELKARLRDEHGQNYFNIIIDGDSLRYIRLDSVKRSYTLASGLPPGEHTIELTKRTEWDKGTTWFYGLEVTGELHELSPPADRVIEFFGNSITAGYAIEDNTGGDSPDSIYTNSYASYAMSTARHFGADCYLTVRSGIGIMVSWSPIIMPEIYDRLDPEDPLSQWDFKKVTPDVVVINLLQNDSWLVELPDHESFKSRFGNKAPDEEAIVNAYRSFVEKISNAYPEAHIICAIGSMDAAKEGSSWPGYIKKAVEPLHDEKIHTLLFPYIQKEGHPRVSDNKKMAAILIDFIEKNVSW